MDTTQRITVVYGRHDASEIDALTRCRPCEGTGHDYLTDELCPTCEGSGRNPRKGYGYRVPDDPSVTVRIGDVIEVPPAWPSRAPRLATVIAYGNDYDGPLSRALRVVEEAPVSPRLDRTDGRAWTRWARRLGRS